MAEDFDPLGFGSERPVRAINTSSDFDPLGFGGGAPKEGQAPPPESPAPSFLNRAIEPLYKATSAIGDLLGSKSVSEFGRAGEEYLKENPDYLGKEQLKEAAVALPTGLLKGTVYGIPSMAAGAAQFAGIAPETSKAVKDWAEEQLNSGDIAQSKNPMTNFLYETGQMIGPSIGPNLAVQGALKALPLVSKGLAVGEKAAEWIAAASTGALFGGQQAQQSKDVALARADQLEKDGDPVAANIMREKASGWAPYATGAIEALGETLGSKYLGALLRYNEHAPMTAKNFLKSLGVEIGTEMGQQYGEAGVEKQVGIRPEADPLSEAIGVIGPTALMTALIGAGGKALDSFRPNVGEAFHNLMDTNSSPEVKATASGIISDQFLKNTELMSVLNDPSNSSRYDAIRNIAENIGEFSPARGALFESWAKSIADQGGQVPIDADMFAKMSKWQADRAKTPVNIMNPGDTNLDPTKSVAEQSAQNTAPDASNTAPGTQYDLSPTVTLYRGEQGDQGGGAWWTDNLERASSFGGNVSQIEVPRSVFEEGQRRAQEQGSATKGDTVLGNEWDKKATPTKAVDTSVHIDENAPSLEELQNMFKGKEETPNGKETSTSTKEANANASTGTQQAGNTNQRGKQSVQSDANATAAKPNVKGTNADRANGQVPGTGSSKEEKVTIKSLASEGKSAFSSKRQMVDFQEFMDKNPQASAQDVADHFFYSPRSGQGDSRFAVAALKEMGYKLEKGNWVRSKEYLSKREQIAKGRTEDLSATSKQYSLRLPETGSAYLWKDQQKADKANKFIGRGQKVSSTGKYAEALKDVANTGKYESTDRVFISAEGKRLKRMSPDFAEIQKAIDAGATLITDDKANRSRDYNVGEREVAQYLTSKGYVESKPGEWTPSKEVKTFSQKEETDLVPKDAVLSPEERKRITDLSAYFDRALEEERAKGKELSKKERALYSVKGFIFKRAAAMDRGDGNFLDHVMNGFMAAQTYLNKYGIDPETGKLSYKIEKLQAAVWQGMQSEALKMKDMPISDSMGRTGRQIMEARELLLNKTGVEPTVEELASMLKRTVAQVKEAMSVHQPMSDLNATIKGSEEEGTEDEVLADTIKDPDLAKYSDYLSTRSWDDVAAIMDTLNPDEQLVITRRFGLDKIKEIYNDYYSPGEKIGKTKQVAEGGEIKSKDLFPTETSMSFKEIAKEMGLSPLDVERTFKVAMWKLNDPEKWAALRHLSAFPMANKIESERLQSKGRLPIAEFLDEFRGMTRWLQTSYDDLWKFYNEPMPDAPKEVETASDLSNVLPHGKKLKSEVRDRLIRKWKNLGKWMENVPEEEYTPTTDAEGNILPTKFDKLADEYYQIRQGPKTEEIATLDDLEQAGYTFEVQSDRIIISYMDSEVARFQAVVGDYWDGDLDNVVDSIIEEKDYKALKNITDVLPDVLDRANEHFGSPFHYRKPWYNKAIEGVKTPEFTVIRLVQPTLNSNQRKALEMYQQGKSMKEIGATMGWSENFMKTYVDSALVQATTVKREKVSGGFATRADAIKSIPDNRRGGYLFVRSDTAGAIIKGLMDPLSTRIENREMEWEEAPERADNVELQKKINNFVEDFRKVSEDNKYGPRTRGLILQSLLVKNGLTQSYQVYAALRRLEKWTDILGDAQTKATILDSYRFSQTYWKENFSFYHGQYSPVKDFNSAENVFNFRNPLGFTYAYSKMAGIDPNATTAFYIYTALKGKVEFKEALNIAKQFTSDMDKITAFRGTYENFEVIFKAMRAKEIYAPLAGIEKVDRNWVSNEMDRIVREYKGPYLKTKADLSGSLAIANIAAKYAREFNPKEAIEAAKKMADEKLLRGSLYEDEIKELKGDFKQYTPTKDLINMVMKYLDSLNPEAARMALSDDMNVLLDSYIRDMIVKSGSYIDPKTGKRSVLTLEDLSRAVITGADLGLGNKIFHDLAKENYDAAATYNMFRIELARRLYNLHQDESRQLWELMRDPYKTSPVDQAVEATVQNSLRLRAAAEEKKANKEAERIGRQAIRQGERLSEERKALRKKIQENKDPLYETVMDRDAYTRQQQYHLIAEVLNGEGITPKPAGIQTFKYIQELIDRMTGGMGTVRFGDLGREYNQILGMSPAERESLFSQYGMDKGTNRFVVGGVTQDISAKGLISVIKLADNLSKEQTLHESYHEAYHAVERIMEYLSLSHKSAAVRKDLALGLKNMRDKYPNTEVRAEKFAEFMDALQKGKKPLLPKSQKTLMSMIRNFLKAIGNFVSSSLTGFKMEHFQTLSGMKTFSADEMFEAIATNKVGEALKVARAQGIRISEADLKDIMARETQGRFSLSPEEQAFADILGVPAGHKIDMVDLNDPNINTLDYEDQKIPYDIATGMAINPDQQPIVDRILGVDPEYSIRSMMSEWGTNLRSRGESVQGFFRNANPYVFTETNADNALYGMDSQNNYDTQANRLIAQRLREMVKEMVGEKKLLGHRLAGLDTQEMEALLSYYHEFTRGLGEQAEQDRFWNLYAREKADYESGDELRRGTSAWLNRRRIQILDQVNELRQRVASDEAFRERMDRIIDTVDHILQTSGDRLQEEGMMGGRRVRGYLPRQTTTKERMLKTEKQERASVLTNPHTRERMAGSATLGGFAASTPHAQARFFRTVLDLWRNGYELQNESIIENVASYLDKGTMAINGRRLQDRLIGRRADGLVDEREALTATDHTPEHPMPLGTIVSGRYDSKGRPYRALEAKSMTVWVPRAEFEGEVTGEFARLIQESDNWKPQRVDGTNTVRVMERVPIYLHPEVYDRLNSYMKKNAFQDNDIVMWFARLGAGIKKTILSSSFFHYFAFLREYMFSNPALSPFAVGSEIRQSLGGSMLYNPVKTYQKGYDLYQKAMNRELNPMELNDAERELVRITRILVQGGATFGVAEDWSERKLEESEHIRIGVEKLKLSTKARAFIRTVGETNEHFLFQKVGVGLKTISGITMFKWLQMDSQRRGENMSEAQIAKIVAEQMNAVYGGLNYKRYRLHKSPFVRAFFNPTLQFGMKMLWLAPDWTMSNLTVLKKIFDPKLQGAEKALYRKWAGIMGARLVGMLVVSNLMVHALAMMFSDDDEDKKLLDRLKQQWDSKDGPVEKFMHMLSIDITPVAKAMPEKMTGGNLEDVHKYYNVLGHFHDPFKAALEPSSFLKAKLGPIPRFFMDAFYGTNFKGETFTNVGELLGMDYEKGTYLVKSGMHKVGDPKWGKLAGKLTKFGPSAPVSMEQTPSFVANEFKQSMPIWLQEALNVGMGYTHLFEFIPRAVLGQQISSDYVPDEASDPEKYVNMMKRKLRADWSRASYKAAVDGEPMDPDERQRLMDRLTRINTKARLHGMPTISRDSLRTREKDIYRYKTPNMEGYPEA